MSRSRSPVFAFLFTALAAGGEGRAQLLQPEPMPDPAIAAYRFPETEATLTRWVTEMNRGATDDIKRAAAAQIFLHGWGLWTALTSESAQTQAGQRLRIFETWRTTDEMSPSPVAGLASMALEANAATPRTRAPLQPLRQLVRTESALERSVAAARETDVDRVMGFVKFDPTAAAHIAQQELLKVSTLDVLLDGGAQQIPPFPAGALVIKPVFQVIRTRDLVAGRYFQLKAWPGPPEVAQPWGPAQWPGAVWLDRFDGGAGAGAIDEHPAADGSSRTEATTYPVSALIHYRLSVADAAALNASKPGPDAAAGDLAVLVAMHVSTREMARWTWQTFWWSPSPDDPHRPSSAAIAAQRPSQLQGAPRHYAMAVSYSMLSPDDAYVGGDSAQPAVYAYNPWIEAGIRTSDLPDSRAGLDPDGRPAANNVGVQTNCMSCHAQANYNPRRLATAPRPSGARYVDLGAAEFVGTLQVDFLWSIARHAR